MRKRTLFIISILLCLAVFVFGALYFGNRIPHNGERPYDYPPARWTAEEPNIWFDIEKDDEDPTTAREITGQLMTEGEIIEIIVFFDYTDRIYISEDSDADMVKKFNGTCKFGPEKMVVTVNEESDTLFNGKYDKITFVRMLEDED